MTDPIFYTSVSAAALAAIGIVSVVGLKGWRDWIALKRDEMQHYGQSVAAAADTPAPNGFARIEVADLKERVRKLEAIAAGVDL